MADKQIKDFLEDTALNATDKILFQDAVTNETKWVGASNLVIPGSVSTAKIVDSAVTSAKMLGVDMFGITPAYTGTAPPAGSGQFYMQGGYAVITTNATGDFTVNFPATFPNGLLTILANDGDDSGNPTLSIIASGCTASAFTGSSSKNSTQVRVSYIAIGF